MGGVSSRPQSPSPSSSPQFDPKIHLAYQAPSKIISLSEIQLPPSPISPVASSIPFPLLSQEAIHAHRRELFSKPVLSNCLWQKRPGAAFIRGAAPRYAPFVHQFWTSPEVLGIVSSIAGVDLVPVIDYEICHTNVQVGEGGLDEVWYVTPARHSGLPESRALRTSLESRFSSAPTIFVAIPC